METLFIDTPAAADAFFAGIQGVDVVALDTEGASFHRFFDRIFLLQVATRQRAAILDPLAAGPLAALGALLASPATEIVLHDAAGDLKSLRHDYGWSVTRIFDTRIAAQFLGVKAFGLASLLAETGVKLDKKYQRADWSMRPLTPAMLAYAAADTAHLLALRDRLHKALTDAGRLPWAEEEFAALEHPVERAHGGEREPEFLRISGARDLSRRGLTFLRALVAWREGIAKERDKAPFRIIGNEQLLALANDPPGVVNDLQRLRGANPKLISAQGGELVSLADGVRAMPESELAAFPKHPPHDRALEARVGKLKAARNQVAEKLGLDAGFLCGGARLDAIARARPRTLEAFAAVEGVRRWQADAFGAAFVQALAAAP